MKEFLYLRTDPKRRLFGAVRTESAGCCTAVTVPQTDPFGISERRIRRLADGRPVIAERPFGGIAAYRPHKKLFFRELETVVRKAGKRLGRDLTAEDLGIVCERAEEAAPLFSRLRVPLLWVFCEPPYPPTDAPVFFSRDERSLARLSAVILLRRMPAPIAPANGRVLFNLTEEELCDPLAVNDAWTRFPPELLRTGISKQVLNSVLFDLDQADKIAALRWGSEK